MLYFHGQRKSDDPIQANTAIMNQKYIIIPMSDRKSLDLWVDGVHVDTIDLSDYMLAHVKTEVIG